MTNYLIAGLMAAVAIPALAQSAPTMAPMTMGHDKVMTRAEVQGHVARMFAHELQYRQIPRVRHRVRERGIDQIGKYGGGKLREQELLIDAEPGIVS